MSPRSRQNPQSLAKAFQSLKDDRLDVRGDYAASKSSRFRRKRSGIPSSGAHGDYHLRNETEFLTIMEYARDMVRNDAIPQALIDRSADNILQGGFTPQPQTGDHALDSEILARWREWSEDPLQCDIAGDDDFRGIERNIFQAWKVDGDVIALLTADGAIESIEAHRIRTVKSKQKNVIHGVEVDSRRRRIRYYVTKEDVSSWATVSKVEEVSRYPVFDEDGMRVLCHVYSKTRLSQTRGVSSFAPVFDLLGMHEDINFAKLVQQQVVSCFTIFRERDKESHGGVPPGGELGATSTETLSDSTTRTLEHISPGVEVFGDPGETIHGFSPNVPNTEYFDQVRLVLQLVGSSIGVPLVLLMLDGSETNFSGWRGALDQAKIGFKRNQRLFVSRFHRPVYMWKLAQWISEDKSLLRKYLGAGKAIYRHQWMLPVWPYIEPLKDAQADALKLKEQLTSPRRLHAERNQDYEDVAREIVADRAIIIGAAIEESRKLSEMTGENISWKDLMPGDTNARVAQKEEEEE